MTSAARVLIKLLVLLLLIHCLLLPPLLCVWGEYVCFLFCCALVSFLILIASKWHLTVSTLCLFLLQCVILAIPGHTHLLFHVILLRYFLNFHTVRKYHRHGSAVSFYHGHHATLIETQSGNVKCDCQELFTYLCVRIAPILLQMKKLDDFSHLLNINRK